MKKLISLVLVSAFLLSFAYADNNAQSEWVLTQYNGGWNVGMFYSLVASSDGTVILIDGGYPENEELVKSVIEAEGGKVDYWFITHYHADHCGAFNAVWPEYKDRIGTVFITPLTWEEYEPNGNPWDVPETFQLFLEQTKDAENIVPLSRGDKFSIGSLQFEVFNAWDEEVTCSEIANNCSLMFRVQSANTSVLFFGDVSFLSSYLLEKYGAESLQADYVQAGHHGWQVPMEVYEAIQPKEMFVDASDELLESEYYADKHGVLINWCEEKGIPVHTFGGTPYSIVLN